jgi:hypothetical protein
MPATSNCRNMQRWGGFALMVLLSLLSPRARASDGENRTERVLAEAGLGLVGGALGLGLGFVAAGELAQSGADGGCIDACGVETLGWALVGGGALGIAGMSLGAYAAAEWLDGDGSLGWTMLGTVSGAALGAAIALVEVRSEAPGGLIGVTLVVPPLVGAVLGYELSSPNASRAAGSSASLDILSVPGGGILGFSGTF